MKKYLLLCLTFVFLGLPSPTQAASLGLSLTPSLVEINISPGKTISQTFTVKNLGAAPLSLVARVVPFLPQEESGQPNLKPNQRPDWLTVFSLTKTKFELGEAFTLQPEESRQLTLAITIPYKMAPTDLYATLLVSSNWGKVDPKQNLTLGAAIGSNLLLTISPVSHPPALVKIENWQPLKQDFLFRYGDYYFADNLSPIRFNALARNAGKYFSKTSGLVLFSKNGQPVSTQALLPLNLLAYSSRILQASPAGEIVFRPQLTALGAYQASLDIRSENGSSHSEITLILLPIKFGLGLILGLILLLAIIKYRPKAHAAKSRSHPHRS